jgi:hypothetical protein
MAPARLSPERHKTDIADVRVGSYADIARAEFYVRFVPESGPRIRPDAEQRPVDEGGRLLLQRLLDAGLSRYEPDPLRALAEAEKC